MVVIPIRHIIILYIVFNSKYRHLEEVFKILCPIPFFQMNRYKLRSTISSKHIFEYFPRPVLGIINSLCYEFTH